MDWYTETPRGMKKLGDPSSPIEFDDISPEDDDYDILGGEMDSMLGCVGDD